MTVIIQEGGMKKLNWLTERRNVIAFWFLGLFNNYGYIVILSASHDILTNFDDDSDALTNKSFLRECNAFGTGIILLVNIIPCVLIRLFSPFIPLYIKTRMTIAILFSIIGFVLVFMNYDKLLVILGVVFTSLSFGLGESSLLSYVVFFKNGNPVSAWSSGTGGAGVVGSLSYAVLKSLGLPPWLMVLLLLIVPLLEAVCYFMCLDHPKTTILQDGNKEIEADTLTFREKLAIIPRFAGLYMAPFGLVYFFQYLITQGLFELLYFPNAFLSHAEQYRWFNVIYQVTVFIAKSTSGIVEINSIWLLAFLQLINLVICILETFYGFMTYLYVLMLLTLWIGLIGGATYINTYRKISTKIPTKSRQFCMSMNSFADVVMVAFAGLIAYPLHDFICTYPSPY